MAENLEEALESLEEAVLGVNEVKSQLEQIKIIRSQFEDKIQETNKKILVVNDQADKISFIHEDIKKSKEEMDKQYAEMQTKLNESLNLTRNDFSSIKKQIQQMQVKINTIENDEKNKHGMQSYSSELTEKLQQLREENQRLKDENATLRMNNDEIEEENRKLKFENEKLKKDVDDLTQQKIEINNKLKLTELKIENGQRTFYTTPEVPTKTVAGTKKGGDELYQFFVSKGCEVVDNRPLEGSLWVVGDETKLYPILKEMRNKFGEVKGSFGTAKAIQHRRGWFTKELIF